VRQAGLPQLATTDWTATLVIVGSFMLPLRTVSLRQLPAFVLSAAAFELTTAVFQSLIKAEYATQAKRRYYSPTLSSACVRWCAACVVCLCVLSCDF